jgi:predicted  nucleic acid-binding Zn-ribbon protein
MPNSESSVLKREKEILERDLKSKEEQLHTLTLRVQQMEKENENLHHRMEMKSNAVKRIPKKPSETMTKLQLKVLSINAILVKYFLCKLNLFL